MRRREFNVLGCLLVGLPLAARAQQSAKIGRIGWMSRGNASGPDGNMNAFRQGMRELGYTEGQGFVIEPRYADGKAEVMPAQAAELERLGVDVIIAGPFEALQAPSRLLSRAANHKAACYRMEGTSRHSCNRGLARRRAAAPVASLNWWRGMFRMAKRRRSSGSVSESASIKVSTVSSLEEIWTRTGASPKSTSWRRPFLPRMMT